MSAIVTHYEYDPYGDMTEQSGARLNMFPLRFSTKYWDQEVGMYYYGYRYYKPEMGRWVNRDPLRDLGFQKVSSQARALDRATTDDVAQALDLDSTDLSPEEVALIMELAARNQTNPSFRDAFIPDRAVRGEEGYLFVRNRPADLVEYLGLACGPGKTGDKFIPDSWGFVFSFGKCCQKHDDCYGDCKGPSKSQCDKDFRICMMRSCIWNPRVLPINKIQCMGVANAYYGAVKYFGGKSFNTARKCCP